MEAPPGEKITQYLLEEKKGKYAANKLRIEFMVKEDQLFMKINKEREYAMLAESGDIFYLENFNTYVKFEKNGNVILHEHGKNMELKKIK